jgi:hypothetical protein
MLGSNPVFEYRVFFSKTTTFYSNILHSMAVRKHMAVRLQRGNILLNDIMHHFHSVYRGSLGQIVLQ